MRAVVVGSSGVIGRHVMTAFASRGHSSVGVDSSSPSEELRGERIRADVRSIDLDDLAREIGAADVVCCLGGSGDARWCNANPREALTTNVEVSVRALELARTLGAQKVIIASTWEVYGPDAAPVATECSPTSPEVPYGAIKLAAERYARAAAAASGLTTVVLRMASTYGPGMRIEGALSAFVKAGIDRTPIRVNGGEQRRSFTFVTDIAAAWVSVAELSVPRDIYNVSGTDARSIADLARLVADRLGTDIELAPSSRNEPPDLLISSAALVDDTGWDPQVGLDEGISQLEKWLRGAPAGSGR